MFYKFNYSKVSFGELWWWAKSNPTRFPISCLCKLLRAKVPCSMDDPNVESLQPFQVVEEALPPFVREAFAPLQAQLVAMGFHSPVYYAISDGFHLTRIYRADYVAPNGEGFGQIHFRLWEKPQPARRSLFTQFITIFGDETFLISSAGKLDLAAPKTCTVNRIINASPDVLWKSHLVGVHQAGKNIYPVTNASSQVWAVERSHAELFNFHVQRGVYQPMNESEQRVELGDRTAFEQMEATGKQHPEVFLEIKKLQEPNSPKWTRLVFILGLSIVAFIALGLTSWSREYVLLLIPILLFHEAGHFIAMKIFGYRNMKMFFIPLFGAAVTGQNFNVAGWKKVVVSLMGPLPGIALGAVLGGVGIFIHNAFLVKFALMLLILNGFNLIPLLPLDGGWALQAIIFSRHYYFDTGFRILAALAMLGLSTLLRAKGLMFVGIATLVSLPISYRVAKVTGILRRQGFVAASPDDQNIPDAVAETIITELKRSMPKGLTTKTLATMTLQVFENLNAKPPGWLASLGLLSCYGFSVLVAVVLAAVMLVVQNKTLGGILANAGSMPRLGYECHSVQALRGTSATRVEPRLNVVMTLKKPVKADEAFKTLRTSLRDNQSMEKIGQTLILSLPSSDSQARQEWLTQFEKYSTDAFVDWTNNSASFSFLGIASSEADAERIEKELYEFFSSQEGGYMAAPWARNDSRSREEKAAYEKARKTYQRLLKASSEDFDYSKVHQLQKKLTDARRRGNNDELQGLTKDIKAASLEVRNTGMAKIRADETTDIPLLELYEKEENTSLTNSTRRDIRIQMGKRMGTIALFNQPATGEPAIYSARSGLVERHGLIVQISFVSFVDAFEGAPALLDWFCNRGLTTIKYSVAPIPYYEPDESDDED